MSTTLQLRTFGQVPEANYFGLCVSGGAINKINWLLEARHIDMPILKLAQEQ